MKLTGHRTEIVYRRYAIVDAGMLREAGDKLAAFHGREGTATEQPQLGTVVAIGGAKNP